MRKTIALAAATFSTNAFAYKALCSFQSDSIFPVDPMTEMVVGPLKKIGITSGLVVICYWFTSEDAKLNSYDFKERGVPFVFPAGRLATALNEQMSDGGAVSSIHGGGPFSKSGRSGELEINFNIVKPNMLIAKSYLWLKVANKEIREQNITEKTCKACKN